MSVDENKKGEEGNVPEKENNSEDQKAKQYAEEAEILDNLPPEAKKMMEMAVSMQSFSGRMPNPILQKITPEHITKILDQSGKEEENTYKDAQSSKVYYLIYVILIIGLIVFLVIFLSGNNKELLTSILDKALYALAGFGGGYGLKAYQDSKSRR